MPLASRARRLAAGRTGGPRGVDAFLAAGSGAGRAPGAGLRAPRARRPGHDRLPTAVAVVVPARDEERLLPACLDSVAAPSTRWAANPDVTTHVVVLDACRDGSDGRARPPRRGRGDSLAGNVGAARAAGVDAAAAWAAGTGSRALWVASTDADSVVPPHWLTSQVEGRPRPALVVGTVTQSQRPPPPEPAAWRQRHTTADGHPHVHGANLGFTWTPTSVGGFAPLPAHEDVALVTAMREAGLTRWPPAPCRTSPRAAGPAVPPTGSRATSRASAPRL